MTGSALPPKKEVMLALLENSSVFIHLDPRKEGVVVSKGFLGQPQLVLQVGLNMAVRIPDLTVEDDGVSCTLSFNRTPTWCHVPWHSVYALIGEDGRGMIWPEDVPPEVAEQASKKGSTPPKPKPKRKPTLQAVHSGNEAEDLHQPSEPPPASRPALRLVPEGGSEPPPPDDEPPPPQPPPAPVTSAGRKPARKGSKPLPSYLRVIK